MLNNLYDVEPENTDTRFPETGNLLPTAEVHETGKSLVPTNDNTLADMALNFATRIFSTDGEGFEVRPAKDEKTGVVWFVADDVCKVLGYTKKTADVIKAHCHKVIDSKDLVDGETEMAHKATVTDANGHGQAMIVISEPDVFRLILRSRMPRARIFERWVMEELLPQVRKTGKYAVRRKIQFENPEDQAKFEAAKAELSGQCELFPNMMPSMTFPKPLTEKINEAKRRLFDQGHTFPNNKEFVKFLITRALEDLNA